MSRRKVTYRPHLEALENRLAPAVVNWINPAGGDWSTASNWSTGQVPGGDDDVVIDYGANDYAVVHSTGPDSVHSLMSHASVSVSGGELLVTANSHLFGSLTLRGTFGGSGTTTVDGLLDFQNGRLSGPGGRLVAAGGSTLVGDGSLNVVIRDGFTLETAAGQHRWLGGNMGLGAGAAWVNGGDLDVTFPGQAAVLANGGGAAFVNTGTLTVAAAQGLWLQPQVTNSGMIRVQSSGLAIGSLGGLATLTAGGRVLGEAGTGISFIAPVTAEAGSRIEGDVVAFNGGAVAGAFRANATTVQGGPTDTAFTGTVEKLGAVAIYGGGIDLTAATLDPGADSLESLLLRGGLVATQTITVAGLFDFQNGRLSGPGGRLVAAGGSTLVGDGSLNVVIRDGFTLETAAGQPHRWLGGNMGLGAGAAWINGGDLEATFAGQAAVLANPGAAFVNTGTVSVTAGQWLGLQPQVTNSGTIRVQSGGLSIGTFGALTTLTASGRVLGDPGTGVSFDAPVTAAAGSRIEGDTVALAGGTVAGAFRANTTIVQGGPIDTAFTGTVEKLGAVAAYNRGLDLTAATLDPGAATLDSLRFDRGGLVANSALSVVGPFDCNFGTLQGVAGQGSLTVLSDLTLNGTYFVRDFNLINAGHAVWAGGTVNFYGDSSFTNAAGASFDIQVDGTFGSADDHCMPFYNDGLLVKSTGPGVTTLHAVLYNSGTVRVDQGIIRLTCGYVPQKFEPTPPGIKPPPGQPQPPFILPPGPTPIPIIPLPVYASYTQTVTGTLIAQIAGHTPPGLYGVPGVDYGQISVSGNVSLDGSFQVRLLNGYVPLAGDQYRIIDNLGPNPIGGIFAGLPEGALVFAGTYGFTVSYVGGDGNDMVLTAAVVNRPPAADAGGPYAITAGYALTLDASASSDPDGDALSYSWTVNGHAEAASGVGPTLTWAQLVALGISGPGTFPVSVTVSDGVAAPVSAATTLTVTFIPASLQGLVFEDFNNDGQVDFGERGIAGVAVTLTGTDDLGQPVNQSAVTGADGTYAFLDLRPGAYAVTETQPAGYGQGVNALGTAGGTQALDQFFVTLAQGVDGLNYNFGERPAAGPALHSGQTAGIGFWQNKNGQNLIKSLNGGAGSTQLADWLAATFPNLYGAAAGANDLAGKTNAQVAAFYVSLFKKTAAADGPPKLDAQVLAAALAVYVTDATLAGTTAAAYGFEVSAYGAGNATFNGATVLDLLLATNAQSRGGLLYDADGSGTVSAGERALRTSANVLYSAINEQGDL